MNSPETIKKRLVKLMPLFKDWWNKDDNNFREDKSPLTYLAIWHSFGHYWRATFTEWSEEERKVFFDQVEEWMNTNDQELLEATKYLVQEFAEEPLSSSIGPYLGTRTLDHFNVWDQ